MKVSIVNAQVPFVRGGAEYLADTLGEKLAERGHKVDQLRIPFKWYPPEAIVDHMLACRLLEAKTGEPDLVIALKFPAYLVPFENKKVWLLHQFRQAYELWGTPLSGMSDTEANRKVRSMIVAADNAELATARGLYTNSKIVANRLRRNNGIEPDAVLYPPLRSPELFREGDFGDYVFYPSRLNRMKRQVEAIEAIAMVRSGLRLVLAGKADEDAYQREIDATIARLGVEDRVVQLGWITEEEKARWMSGAFAALYLPIDEDSYGYVTLEAFQSGKPVVTFTDSGGVDELVEDGENGLILEPSPESLAEGLERLRADPAGTRAMGRAALATLAKHRIDWDHVLETLLS